MSLFCDPSTQGGYNVMNEWSNQENAIVKNFKVDEVYSNK